MDHDTADTELTADDTQRLQLMEQCCAAAATRAINMASGPRRRGRLP